MLRFQNGRPAGRFVVTRGAEGAGVDLAPLLARHLSCDWGDMPEEDKKSNDEMLPLKGMVMSSYTVDGQTIWIITDAGHAVTTALLPDEY